MQTKDETHEVGQTHIKTMTSSFSNKARYITPPFLVDQKANWPQIKGTTMWHVVVVVVWQLVSFLDRVGFRLASLWKISNPNSRWNPFGKLSIPGHCPVLSAFPYSQPTHAPLRHFPPPFPRRCQCWHRGLRRRRHSTSWARRLVVTDGAASFFNC